MRKLMLVFMMVSFLLVPGCSQISINDAVDTPIPVSDLLIAGNNKFTPTPTPFQPILPVIKPVSTPTAQPSKTALPVNDGMITLGLERPSGQVNILLLGSDWRPGQGYRTDVMMILSLIPERNSVTLLSFPRDLYVNIPSIGYERINAAQAYGGLALSKETLSYNFDAPVDYYMMTNYAGFKSIIDTLGGITVYSAYELYDRCDLPQAYNKMCYIPAGANTMNGQTALWYVRSRYSTSDFDRTRRAQEVILAIAQKMMSLNAINRAPELYNLFSSSVETDIPLDVVVKLLPMAADIVANPGSMQRFTITEEQISHYVVPETGAMVLIPDYNTIAETIRKALFP